MRRSFLLATAGMLLVAGCATPFGEKGEEPVTPAAQEEPIVVAASPTPAPTPATPSPSSSPPSSSAPSSSASSSPPPPPPAPMLVVWNLTASARLGYVAAVGVSAAPSPVPPQTDADHCPDASFTLPAGAKGLVVSVQGQPASPETQSAGTYDIIVTDPAGTAAHLEPFMDNVPGGEGGNSVATYENATAGVWTLHAEPVGPAAQQVWTIKLDATGESQSAPAEIAITPGC